MGFTWETETGYLRLHWDEAGSLEEGLPRPELEGLGSQGSHLEPAPDFAAHSPFGGATWFYPDPSIAIERKER